MILEREIYTQHISKYLDSAEAIIITGMRRVGKTSLLKFVYNKIDSKNKLFLDLENPLNQKYFEEENFDKIKYNLEIQGIDLSEKAYIFLDEIQFVKNTPQVVKYLADHYQIKFFLTGSSSFYLKNQFSESLSGRKYIFELYPLSFEEFLRFKKKKLLIPDKNTLINQTIYHTFSPLYEEYLQFGGFPQVVLKDNFEEKKLALNDIFSSYFQLEVVQLGDFRKTDVVRDLILLLAGRISSKLDIQKLASNLGISRPTVYDYLAFLQGTYFIKLIKPYSQSKDVEVRGAEKVYLCDSGLANHIAQIPPGDLFENNIFQQLNIKGELNYYQKSNQAEIDFILNKGRAFEVKLIPSPQEEAKFRQLCQKLNFKEYYLVSKRYSEFKNICYGFNLYK